MRREVVPILLQPGESQLLQLADGTWALVAAVAADVHIDAPGTQPTADAPVSVASKDAPTETEGPVTIDPVTTPHPSTLPHPTMPHPGRIVFVTSPDTTVEDLNGTYMTSAELFDADAVGPFFQVSYEPMAVTGQPPWTPATGARLFSPELADAMSTGEPTALTNVVIQRSDEVG